MTQGPLLVRLTIPAKFVRKTPNVHWDKAPETTIYLCLESAFNLNLGRCKWDLPIEIVATPEQFGVFIVLLRQNERSEVINETDFELFRQGTPKPVTTKFNASDNPMKRIDAPYAPIEIER